MAVASKTSIGKANETTRQFLEKSALCKCVDFVDGENKKEMTQSANKCNIDVCRWRHRKRSWAYWRISSVWANNQQQQFLLILAHIPMLCIFSLTKCCVISFPPCWGSGKVVWFSVSLLQKLIFMVLLNSSEMQKFVYEGHAYIYIHIYKFCSYKRF